MKRFAILFLLSMALVACNDPGNGSGQSYSAPAPPTHMPYGEPFVVDEREEDRLMLNLWDAVMENNETTERRNVIN